MRSIELEVHLAAAPRTIWALLADHERMPEWMPVREVVRRRAGAPDPNGVGAVRTIRGGGLVVEERITGWKPPERMEYTLVAGAPIRDHRGSIELSPEGGGTRLRWRVRFRPLVPGTGWIAERLLARSLRRGLAALREKLSSR